MDMDGGKLAATQTTQKMQQHDRIATAGKPHPKVRVRLKTGGTKGADPFLKIS